MAGDWIKMRNNLWDDPRVAHICDLTNQSEAAIVGGLYWLWASADQHSENGIMPGLTTKAINRKTGIQGFAEALISIGWLFDRQEGVRIPRFEEHNGASAKRRSMEAQRKASSRTLSASDADNVRTQNGQGAELEEEIEKNKENPPNGGLVPGQKPATPHQDIIAIYHEILPICPTVREWSNTRKKYLKSRWLESTDRQNLDWWRRFFRYVSKSDFLTGKLPGRNNGPPFLADLEWLIKPSNFVKVIEGKYHGNGGGNGTTSTQH